MNWRKITKYFILLLVLSIGVFVFLLTQNLTTIYGGHTQVVDYKAFKPSNEAVCIQNVNILSPDGNAFIANQTVCIENGIVSSIDSVFQNSNNSVIINGEGKFLIPGLIDSHVHLFNSQNDLLLYVANGVTEIREMIGEEDHLKWRREIKEGRIGPDMYIASPRLGSFGMVEGWFMKWTQGFNNVRNAKEAQTLVNKYSRKGYDAVKIYSHLNKESYEALCKEGKSHGMDVVGHVPWSVELPDIMHSNQSEIAHLEEVLNAIRREFGKFHDQKGANEFLAYVDKRSVELVNEFIENDVSVTTTLWLVESFVRQKFELEKVLKEIELVYENPGISEWNERIPQGLGWLPEINRYKMDENLSQEEIAWQKTFWSTYAEACRIILKNLSSSGVNIMAGTDANLPPTVPGFSLHDELISLNQAGMSTSQVLQSVTSIPAKWLGSNTGQVVKGYKANLILLEEDPLDNIANTRKINTVFLNGKILDRAILDQMLESVKQANDSSRKKAIDQYMDR